MRRFLQGLGLGLLVAALVMGINTRKDETLAGEALVERAREIGMVFPASSEEPSHFSGEDDDKEVTAPETEASTGGAVGAGVGGEEGSTTAERTSGDKADKSAGPEETKEPKKTEKPEQTRKPEQTDKPKETSSPKPESTPDKTKKPRPTTPSDINATPRPRETELPEGTTVQFEVRSGLLSSSVARELYEAGVIDDMWEFDHYIEDHGLGHYIRAGTYELKVGDSYENIANIITHRD